MSESRIKDGSARHRSFSAEELMPELISMLSDGHPFSLTVTGESMAPFLRHGRDSVTVSPLCEKKLRAGDVLLYRRGDGRYVIHRLACRRADKLMMLGDGQAELEPIDESDVLGRVDSVVRRGKPLTRRSPVWFFYAHIWRWRFTRKLAHLLHNLSKEC